jgi:TPR repeat protein
MRSSKAGRADDHRRINSVRLLPSLAVLVFAFCAWCLPGAGQAQDLDPDIPQSLPPPDTEPALKPMGENATETFRRLAASAGAGDAPAQLKLGMAYLDGKDLPRDPQLAAHWIREAAQQDLSDAEVQWAKLEQQGVGTPVDATDAINWLRRATGQGNAQATYLLARALRDGVGSSIDIGEAAHWFGVAANAGNVEAQIAFGDALQKGDGIEPNPPEAIYWFRRAAEQGSPEGRYRWAMALLGNDDPSLGAMPSRDTTEGIKILRQAADQNYPPAQYRLGQAYLKGIEAAYDPDTALRLIGAAADKGYTPALARLGEIYADGKLVPPDPVRAYVNLELAVELGEVRASTARNAAAAALSADQLVQTKRRIRDWRVNRGL